MKTDNWDELVARGREVVATFSKAQWALGDLSFEVEPPGQQGVSTGARGRIAKYAEAIGIAADTLRGYRTSAAAWPPEHRQPDVSFAVHRVLQSRSDRFDLLKQMADEAAAQGRRVKVDDVRERVGAPRYVSIDVRSYERRPPGTVTPIEDSIMAAKKVLAKSAYRRRLFALMTPYQIGNLIDDAWAALEQDANAA